MLIDDCMLFFGYIFQHIGYEYIFYKLLFKLKINVEIKTEFLLINIKIAVNGA